MKTVEPRRYFKQVSLIFSGA